MSQKLDPVASQISDILSSSESDANKVELCLRFLKRETRIGGLTDPYEDSNHNYWNIVGLYLWINSEFELAAKLYSEMRDHFLSLQETYHRRIHKGTAYFNLAFSLLATNRYEEARMNVILAYIEDIFSHENPSADPAYVTLKESYGIKSEFLETLRNAAKTESSRSIEPPYDPSEILHLVLGSSKELVISETVAARPRTITYIEDELVKLDKKELSVFVQKVEKATSNDEKKKSLESMSEFLFKSIDRFTIINNTRTGTGELDRIIRNENNSHPFLIGLGNYILVECKNWDEAVGASQVRILLDKMNEHSCKTGIMLTKNGLTGSLPDGKEALGRIASKFKQDQSLVLVLDLNDVKRIVNCENIIRILREKEELVRFA